MCVFLRGRCFQRWGSGAALPDLSTMTGTVKSRLPLTTCFALFTPVTATMPVSWNTKRLSFAAKPFLFWPLLVFQSVLQANVPHLLILPTQIQIIFSFKDWLPNDKIRLPSLFWSVSHLAEYQVLQHLRVHNLFCKTKTKIPDGQIVNQKSFLFCFLWFKTPFKETWFGCF